jgi:adenylate cyclase
MDPIDPRRFGPEPKYTAPQVAELSGLDQEFGRRIYRALGFPDVTDETVEFDERDVEVLRTLGFLIEQGYSEDDIISVARTYGQALSRVAHAEVRLFRKRTIDPLVEEGAPDEEVLERLDRLIPGLLDLLGNQIDHVHRRHLVVALQQLTAAQVHGATERLAAGFVDLVDFSRLTNDIEAEDLGAFVSRFETLAVDLCVDHGAQVVKVIGDAVMFVATDAADALKAALAIIDAVKTEPDLPSARAGIDLGDVVPMGGDYFGRAINVAARLTGFARPDTTVVSQELLKALEQPAQVTHLGQHRLKGVGEIRIFKVKAYPDPDPAPEPSVTKKGKR